MDEINEKYINKIGFFTRVKDLKDLLAEVDDDLPIVVQIPDGYMYNFSLGYHLPMKHKDKRGTEGMEKYCDLIAIIPDREVETMEVQ